MSNLGSTAAFGDGEATPGQDLLDLTCYAALGRGESTMTTTTKKGSATGASGSVCDEPALAGLAAKRVYSSPELTSWGSIVELTKGPINGTIDGFFSGTGGT